VLQQAANDLGEWLAPRAIGMAGFAAQDIVQALAQASHFLRDRLLQTAFGVHDLWGLLNTVGSAEGADAGRIRGHVELGRHGATVLGWLAGAVPQQFAFAAAGAEGQRVMAAAEAWRMAWVSTRGSSSQSGASLPGRSAAAAP
jgi:hypothetical protein